MDFKVVNISKYPEGEYSNSVVVKDVKEIKFLPRPSQFSGIYEEYYVVHDEQDIYRSTYTILIVTEDKLHLFPMRDRVILPA